MSKTDLLMWITNNKEWLFSGIAIAVPLAVVGWLLGTRKGKQIQKSGSNSTNIQVGGNVTIKSKKNDQ
jgi:hypothetical protein